MSKVAVVTGAGSGIGRAVSIALGASGYNLVLAGRRAAPLHETAKAVTSAGGVSIAIPTDVAKAEEVGYLFNEAVAKFGRVDLLFNNAGTNVPATPIDELSLEDWKQVIDVNLTGSFLCAQAAFRVMKTQSPCGGRIINNGSISAYAPRPDSAPYTSSKHAIQGLTKCLSLDGRKFDIACGQIDIGNATTDLAAGMAAGCRQANGEIAAEPMIDVAQVGEAVVYMAALPLHANVQFMTLMATKMPFVGRG